MKVVFVDQHRNRAQGAEWYGSVPSRLLQIEGQEIVCFLPSWAEDMFKYGGFNAALELVNDLLYWFSIWSEAKPFDKAVALAGPGVIDGNLVPSNTQIQFGYRTFTVNLEDYKGPLKIISLRPDGTYERPDGMYPHMPQGMAIAGPILAQESNPSKLSVLAYMPSHGLTRKTPRKPAVTKK